MHACGTRLPGLILLPGMGTDARLFAPQRDAFPDLIVPDWIPARPGESLADYARRWAGTVACDRSVFIGGVSFGGMVALEAARHLRPAGVFLIASCRSGRAVARRFLTFMRAGWVLPSGLLARLRGPVAGYVARVEKLNAAHRQLLRGLATDAPVPFLRWTISAIRDWSWGPDPATLDVPIHRIHGRRDRLIPFVPGEADHVVEDGGHLINLTHADEVNRFIRSRMGLG